MTSPREGTVRSAGECRDILCHIAPHVYSCLVDVTFSRTLWVLCGLCTLVMLVGCVYSGVEFE